MKFDRNLVAGTNALLVLSLLGEGEKYGYQIITELAARSQNVFEMKEGTLYPVLHALEAEALVTARTEKTEGGRARRWYSITKKGRARLKEKAEEWTAFSGAVNHLVLGLA